MFRTTPLPELLAPAGSRDALIGAVEGGADAVYFGTKGFNARAYADNFDRLSLADTVAFCHDRGVRAYVTLNTLVRDRERDDFLREAEAVCRAGADAVIIADAGMASLLRTYLPELSLHASTQMSAHSVAGADELYDALGIRRVVLARELSREDIAYAVREAKAEIEVFLHGALCVCHSGQCLFSSLVGGRSGNRGECAQPCRLPYNHSYPLSLKDSCLASHVPSLIDSGVSSLKIEGRMKSPAYVHGVTQIYRRLLDEGRAATKKEIDALAALFSRGGFTDGYYTKHLSGMGGIRTEADKARTSSASYRPQSVITQNKGDARPDCALPPVPASRPVPSEKKFLRTATVSSPALYDALYDAFSAFFDCVYLPLSRLSEAKHVPMGVVIPPVVFDSEREECRALLRAAKARGVTHALVGNVGALSLAREASLVPDGDFRLNITNTETANFYASRGVCDRILSPELTLPQMRDIGGRAIVYGRIPLMILERCVTRENGGCDACGKFALTDRTGARFPVLREYRHRSLILNSVPTYMGDKKDALQKARLGEHFIFTNESVSAAKAVLRAYETNAPLACPVRRIAQK